MRRSKTVRRPASSSLRRFSSEEGLMNAVPHDEKIITLTTHYIDGAFVESHGREVMDVVRPSDGQVIGRATLADEEDTRRAIAAARRAFATYGRSTKKERMEIL